MKLKAVLVVFILLILAIGGYFTFHNHLLPKLLGKNISFINLILPRHEVIGFLPYWLIGRAQNDYSDYITTLTYFSLSLNKDGTIQKFTHPGESEPGYLALNGGKIDSFLTGAREKNVSLSLAVFSGDDKVISSLLENPEQNAQNLVNDVTPVMEKYGFTDLNLDIEQSSSASPEARTKFTEFVRAVRNHLNNRMIKSLSVDISASAFVKSTNLADPAAIAPLVDKVIIMAYDYHNPGSYVTGPVAPGEGAGTVSEFDTRTAVIAALKVLPAKKLILGIPLYGYGWESIGDIPRSAVIPGTGLTVSNASAETFLASCSTCSAQFDGIDKENHIIYRDEHSGTYHQIFYPDQKSTQYKVGLAEQNSLAGVALWALGYEGDSILKPLSVYHN